MGVASVALIVAAAAATTAATAAVVGGAIQSGKEHKAMRKARTKKEEMEFKIKELMDDRQDIINPYAGTTSLAGMASDLTGMMHNPFEGLGVATQAAEIQAEEADISLANTLDMLRATGASAGGATALAQAALASKKGVSASIEKQETINEQLRAQGDQALIKAQVLEQQRLQTIAISEGAREQAAQAQGKIFEYDAQEDRTNADISYIISKETGAAQREDAATRRRDAAVAGIFTGVGEVASGVASTAGTAAVSDRRLKKNIKLIGKSSSGLKIYAFEYIDKIFGDGIWQGVMSDEISQEAVIKHVDGYDRVDYSQLDVEFKQI